MENEAKIKYLQRAGIAYLIAGLAFLGFGFPFWFLHAVDKKPHGHSFPPFFFVADDLLMAPVERWVEFLSILGLLVGSVSFWKAGEPTGLGARRNVVLVPIVGSICYLLSIWVVLPFAPLGAFLNGLGMILVGIASLKARIWTDWKRYVPLLVGCFPFLFMFPLLILTGHRPTAIIGLWGLPWILLGIASWLRSKAS